MSNSSLDAIKSAGVVGAGGAGFPTWMKLKARPDTIIVNGAECEPLLRVDQLLMARYPKEIAHGLQAILTLTGAKAGIVALKQKYTQALVALQKSIKDYEALSICILDDIYPSGDEQVLVYTALKRSIPPGQIPLSVGVVVINVETLLNVHWALVGQPITHKYVTITGAVNTPCTIRVPLGTAIREVIKQAGGPRIESYALINGGPCMGSLTQENEVITKTTNGIVALPEDHPVIIGLRRPFSFNLKRAMSVCNQCQRCTELCPRHLLGHPIRPHMTMRMMAYNMSNLDVVKEALLCSECGACDLYACSFGLSPRQVNRMIKQELRQAGTKIDWLDDVGKPHAERDYRLIPTKRLINSLALHQYDVPAPWYEGPLTIEEVKLPLKQHIGAAAAAIVKIGDMVSVGQLIAQIPSEVLGVNLHASIQGVITGIHPEITIVSRQEDI